VEIAVVEHKAQTHFEGFLHSFLLLSTEVCDAGLYFRRGQVRHISIAKYRAVWCDDVDTQAVPHCP